MSAPLYDSIVRIARHEAEARVSAAAGIVTASFPADGPIKDHAVTVRLRESGLVLPRVPIAVGLLGSASIPAVDELVVVVFLDGDANAPVVVGRLYHPHQDPPEHADGETVVRLPSGEADPGFNFVLSTTEPTATLELPGDVLLEVAEGKVAATVGKLTLTLDSAGGGRVEVAAAGSSIVLEEDGAITVKAKTTLHLEANEVVLKGTSKVTVSGGVVEVN